MPIIVVGGLVPEVLAREAELDAPAHLGTLESLCQAPPTHKPAYARTLVRTFVRTFVRTPNQGYAARSLAGKGASTPPCSSKRL